MEKLLKLRALEPSDLELLYSFENDISHWGTSSAPYPYSRWALKQFIRRSAEEDIYALKQLRLVIEIWDNESATSVGFIDLVDFSPQHQRAEVGIAIVPQYRRAGWALKALMSLIDYANSALSLHQLYAYVMEDNFASRRLFVAAGFTPTAVLRNWFYKEKTFKNAVLFQKSL